MAVVAIATSCSEEKQPTGDNWGATEWYPDRFYYSYDPVRMTKTLEFEFNDDAREYLKGDDGYFELAISSSPQTYTKPTNINSNIITLGRKRVMPLLLTTNKYANGGRSMQLYKERALSATTPFLCYLRQTIYVIFFGARRRPV